MSDLEVAVAGPTLRPGDRVRARQHLSGLLRPSVPRGTGGVVLRLGQFGSVLVHFDNGRAVETSDSLLEREAAE